MRCLSETVYMSGVNYCQSMTNQITSKLITSCGQLLLYNKIIFARLKIAFQTAGFHRVAEN